MVDKLAITFVPLQWRFDCMCGNVQVEPQDGVVVCGSCGQSEPIADMKPKRIDSGDTIRFEISPMKFHHYRKS